MAKFLFVVPPFTGHINPTLGLGSELLKNGHEVAWTSIDPKLEYRVPDGASFILLTSNIDDVEKERIKNELLNLAKKAVYGIDSLKFLYHEVLNPMNEGMLESLRESIDKYKPDVIINDHQMFSGVVAAIEKNIPYVTSVTAPAAIKVNDALPKINEWEGEQIIAFQRMHGIEGNVRLDCSSTLTLVYTSKYFFGETDLPDYYKFIGPVINRTEQCDEFDWERLENMGNRPKILVSIGTTFDHSQKQVFFNKVIEAFSSADVSVVVISDPELFSEKPANFIIAPHVPQLKLIPQMDLVVCHGGFNTVCESLSHAVPLIVLPIAYDQSYVAGCVVGSGAGIRLNFNRFKGKQLQEAAASIFNDSQYVENAKLVQKSFNHAGGVIRAAEFLENLIKK